MREQHHPILIIDPELGGESFSGGFSRRLAERLKRRGFTVIEAADEQDAADLERVVLDTGALVLGYAADTAERVARLRRRNALAPIFLMLERDQVPELPLEVAGEIAEYVWKTEEDPDFVAGRIEAEARRYAKRILPPFFRALVDFNDTYEYSWHTPGHAGGAAFLKAPAGQAFHRFVGANLLRADLSVSVGELGSLNDHTGPVKEAEQYAAKVFGAHMTFFVTNGTSTSNRVALQGCVVDRDPVLVDRNCHKSIEQALTLTGGTPRYLKPVRNGYGLIGPITPGALREASGGGEVAYTVITNSTYDGLCYHVGQVMEALDGVTPRLHFDEAWYGYARFNPLYAGRYAMHGDPTEKPAANQPTLIAGHSTHKLLAALSQASMLHIRNGAKGQLDHERFNEAFMMHASTSPQYAIIASNDVTTAMMDAPTGETLTREAIAGAVAFRKLMARGGGSARPAPGATKLPADWWFGVWQPDEVTDPNDGRRVKFAEIPDQALITNPRCWELEPDAAWHGFAGLEPGYCMLDPIKVTVTTPGAGPEAAGGAPNLERFPLGIPAALVSRYLGRRGIVVEKTSDYAMLFLFSIGNTTGKWATLISALYDFKRLYDEEAPLEEVFPELVADHPAHYAGLTLPALCARMHEKTSASLDALRETADQLPEPAMRPIDAYRELVRGNVTSLPVDELDGQVVAVGVVPYPPGIPFVMPGERVADGSAVKAYLQALQRFDRCFPGFDHDIHGITTEGEPNPRPCDDGDTDPTTDPLTYHVLCLTGD